LCAAKIDPTRCTLTFAWVGDAGFGYSNALHPLENVSDAMVAWSVAALNAGFDVVRPSMKTTCQICSVPGGQHGAVINADGKLYSCWQSAGKPGYEVGSINDGYSPLNDVRERWVCCGYEYKQTNSEAMAKFHDLVDSQFLDHLYTSGHLNSGDGDLRLPLT